MMPSWGDVVRSHIDDRHSRRGQATIEIMLVAFVGVVFAAVAFQLHLVNRAVSRTLGEVHGTMLAQMYRFNSPEYDYDRETVKVIWSPQHGIPSSHDVPRLGLFRGHLPTDLRVYSHWVEQHGNPDPSCGESPPCKRTKAGGGLQAGRPWTVAWRSVSSVGSGHYLGWLLHNAESAALDLADVREVLQEVQNVLQVAGTLPRCMDDMAACLTDCVDGHCPWE
jgi:hypothetical protein